MPHLAKIAHEARFASKAPPAPNLARRGILATIRTWRRARDVQSVRQAASAPLAVGCRLCAQEARLPLLVARSVVRPALGASSPANLVRLRARSVHRALGARVKPRSPAASTRTTMRVVRRSRLTACVARSAPRRSGSRRQPAQRSAHAQRVTTLRHLSTPMGVMHALGSAAPVPLGPAATLRRLHSPSRGLPMAARRGVACRISRPPTRASVSGACR